MTDKYYGRWRGKAYHFYYPVKQWMGPERRGIPYKSYVIKTEDDNQWRHGGSSVFVWKDGDWKSRRVTLEWGDYQYLKDIEGRLPRSFYPCMEGDILIHKETYALDTKSVRLVKTVIPAGSLSRVGVYDLLNSDWTGNNKGEWVWKYIGMMNGDSIIRAWRKLEIEELMSEALMVPIIEANLTL